MSDQPDAGPLPELTPEQESEVRRLLAEARHDEPIPVEVGDRLDRVLAGLTRDEPGSPGRGPGRRPRRPAAAAQRRRPAGRRRGGDRRRLRDRSGDRRRPATPAATTPRAPREPAADRERRQLDVRRRLGRRQRRHRGRGGAVRERRCPGPPAPAGAELGRTSAQRRDPASSKRSATGAAERCAAPDDVLGVRLRAAGARGKFGAGRAVPRAVRRRAGRPRAAPATGRDATASQRAARARLRHRRRTLIQR